MQKRRRDPIMSEKPKDFCSNSLSIANEWAYLGGHLDDPILPSTRIRGSHTSRKGPKGAYDRAEGLRWSKSRWWFYRSDLRNGSRDILT
jgi:hypothetical protein